MPKGKLLAQRGIDDHDGRMCPKKAARCEFVFTKMWRLEYYAEKCLSGGPI